MPPTQRIASDPEGGTGISGPARVPGVDLRDPQYRTLDGLGDVLPEPEPDPEPVLPPAQNQPSFTVEQLEKARREERDKVNKRLEALRLEKTTRDAELEELRMYRAQQEAEAEKTRKADEKKTRKAAEADMSAKEILAAREAEWEAQREADRTELMNQLEQMRREREQERAQVTLERQALELRNFITARVNEEVNAGTIAPQFVDFITGTTPEDVERMIELAQTKTTELLQDIASREQGTPQPPPRRGVSTASGPSMMGSVTEVNEDQVDYTKLSLKDYIEKVRPKLQIERRDNGIFS